MPRFDAIAAIPPRKGPCRGRAPIDRYTRLDQRAGRTPVRFTEASPLRARAVRLRDYLQLVRQRVALVAVVVGVVVAGTLGLSLLQEPRYEATVRLRARPPAPGSSVNPVLTEAEQQRALAIDLATEAELVRSTEVADRVRERLRLSTSSDSLIDDVEVTQVPNASVLLIAVSADDERVATSLANEFAAAYLDVRRADAAKTLDEQAEDARARLAEVQQRLSDAEARLAGLDPASVSYAAVKAERDAAVNDRDVILRQLVNLTDRRALASGFGQVIQPANAARAVRERSLPRTGVFGVLIGVPLALAVVLLLDTLSDRVQTVAEVEERTGSEVIGLIPIDEAWTSASTPRLVGDVDPYSPAAEAYRTLALTLRNAVDGGARTVLVTSPGGAEAKTTTAVNLAVAHAESGRRVVLVDADLREPRAYQFLGADFTPGVAEVLRGELDLRDAVQRLRSRLAYLGPGLPAGRAELLLVRADLRGLLEEAAAVHESPPARPLRAARATARPDTSAPLVVVDAPPVLSAAEVSSLVAAVDAVVLLVRVGATSRASASRAAEQVRRAGGRLLGVVLVGVRSLDDVVESAPRRDVVRETFPESGADTGA